MTGWRSKVTKLMLLPLVLAGVLFATERAEAGSETYTVTCLYEYYEDDELACTNWSRALSNANAHPGHDTIRFAIPGPGPHVLEGLVDGNNRVTDSVTIDGYSQPGSQRNTLRHGSNAIPGVVFVGRGRAVNFDFHLLTSGSEIHGVAFTNFGSGLYINGDRNVISGNFFTPFETQSRSLEGNNQGIWIQGRENQIGGPERKDRNIISGNGTGVYIRGEGDRELQRNAVMNNLIGTTADGATAWPNFFGVDIFNSSGNSVGVSGLERENVISGNDTGVLIRISDQGTGSAIGNRVVNNLIGTDASGTNPVSNIRGVETRNGAAGTIVGGSGAGERNWISGNGMGLAIEGAGHVIQGNTIGLGVSGARVPNSTGISLSASALNVKLGGETTAAGESPGNVISGNDQAGVAIEGRNVEVRGNLIRSNKTGISVLGGSGHVIGGASGSAANKIASNRTSGVVVTGDSSRAQMLRNSFGANEVLAIDLNNDAETENDSGDGDAGPNSRQNFPELTSVVSTSTGLMVSGSLNSLPNRDHVVQFFGQPGVSSGGVALRCSVTSDRGQGIDYLGQTTVRTGPDGNATFAATIGRADPSTSVSATATGPDGTSEFSYCATPSQSADMRVWKTAPPGARAGSNFTYTVEVRNDGPSTATGVVMEDELQPTTTFVSMTPPRDWTCTHPAPGSGGRIRCERTAALGASPEWHRFTIVGRVPADTPDGALLISTAATVVANEADPNTANNQSSASFTVSRGADLAMTNTASSATVAPGGALTYALQVTNAGPSDAATVGIEDALGTDVTFVRLTHPPGWTCRTPPPGYSGGRVNCDIDTLAAGTAAQDFTVTVNVAESAAGTIVNRATVLAATTDPDESDNSATARTTVGGDENPRGQAGVQGTITVAEETQPPSEIRSVVVDPPSFGFADCVRDDGTPAAGMTFPNGRCASPVVTVTNTGAPSNIHVAGTDAVPSDSGPSWVLCYSAACSAGPDLPGDDQFLAQVRSTGSARTQALDTTPRCDQAFASLEDGEGESGGANEPEEGGGPGGGCLADSGETQTELIEVIGPRASSSAARSFSTTFVWTANP